ncbi:hypothetical protein J437_LFUL015216 [Ladona fulva]|uniref:Uncharacterized protein n=1 Tax=Ladona fulva TaxID=123851 RepID=A0A8K0KNS7_LADFU|nr:hypothetical protein J437_LFUL015216 [Ladona fulva]
MYRILVDRKGKYVSSSMKFSRVLRIERSFRCVRLPHNAESLEATGWKWHSGICRNKKIYSCVRTGKRYNDDDDVKTAVNSWLSEQAASPYEEGSLKLVERYDKCLNKLGNYVEK